MYVYIQYYPCTSIIYYLFIPGREISILYRLPHKK